jgi:glycosyltransferase involved in cell wall biosynthesis
LVSVAGANVEVFCVASGDLDTARDRFEADVHARCHLVPSQPRSITTALGALLERISPFMYEFKTSGIGDVFRKACERSLPDVVQIQQMQAYYAIRPHVPWLKSHGVKIVLDCHNIEFRSFGEWLEVLPWPQKIAGKFLAPNLKKIETDAARESDMVFACSESDADFFRQYNPNTHVIPNGVDCSEFQPVEKKQNAVPALIFMGGVKYPPNADALQFYLSDIHPKIKERLPDVVMLAIGADKGWLNSVGLNNPSVKPLGFVEDVRPYLTQADIGICPVRYGSGTRIKIMTYMAAGLPVVSTAKGAEGVTYTNGHDIIITDDPKEFANAILKLFNDPAYRDRIARNGREFILKNYDWNVIGEKLAHAYEHDLR